MSTVWPSDGSVGIRTAAEFEAMQRTSFGVKLLSDTATGSGSDESAALQSAVNAAIVTGKRLTLDPHKTYVVGTMINIAGPLLLDGKGATIKKTPALNARAVNVTGTSVEIRDLNVDGNRAGGNTFGQGCVIWQSGAKGLMRNVKMTQSALAGYTAASAGTVVDLYDCEGTDHDSGAGAGEGFGSYTGAVSFQHNCKGNNNGRYGSNFDPSAGDGCGFDGGQYCNNLDTGLRIDSDKGIGLGLVVANNNKNFNIRAVLANDWTFLGVQADDCGQGLNGEYAPHSSATAVRLQGCARWKVSDFGARRPLGYGLAVLQSGSTPTTDSHFGSIYVQAGADPGIIVGGLSNNNTFGEYTSVDNTIALSFDEGSGAANNNHFPVIHAIRCPFVVVVGGSGSYNTLGHVIAEDCSSGLGGYQSFIKWDTGCVGNVTSRFDSYNPYTTAPAYIVEHVGAAAGNKTLNVNAATPPTTGLNLDAGGANRVAVEGGKATTVQAANYTLVAADAVAVVECTKATAQTVTVPPNSSVAFPIGTTVPVSQVGAGQVTLTPGSGVTIRTASSLTTRAQYSTVYLRKRGTNEWVASGDLT